MFGPVPMMQNVAGQSSRHYFFERNDFMAEFTNANTVSVAAGQNVPLTETAVAGKGCVVHREGAGIVTLRGITNQCKARFKVGFGANIAIPTGGTVGAITAALAITAEQCECNRDTGSSRKLF